MKTLSMALGLIIMMGIVACNDSTKANQEAGHEKIDNTFNEKNFHATLEKHLNAVSDRDLQTLKSTMHPDGKMQLILPGTEIIEGVDGFMNYHDEWFKMPDWTFETKILNIDVGTSKGIGITEVIYREPERDGKAYFNKMIVSYALEKYNEKWFVIKDHASSVEKSTDQ